MYTTLYCRKLGHSFTFRRLVHTAAPPPQVKLRIKPVYYVFAGFAGACILGAVTYFNVSNKPLPLEPSRFTSTKLSSSEICRDTDYKSIELQLPEAAHPTSVPKPIWSAYVKDHDIQIERPFTPINPLDKTGRLKFWVKRYEHGEMGRWLCAQPVGQSIEIRGPIQTLDWSQEHGKWDHVLMISGGTGITPFVQLIQHLVRDLPRTQRITLLHSSPTPNALPPPEVLGPIIELSSSTSEPWFTARLFVDTVPDGSIIYLGQILEVRRIGLKDIRNALNERKTCASRLKGTPSDVIAEANKTLVLVCGPDSMIKAIAGPRISEQDPGPVLGLLKTLGFDDKSVRKL